MAWSGSIARPVVAFARRRPLGGLGALILVIMIVVAVTAPLIAPFDPRSVHVKNKFASPGEVVEKTENGCGWGLTSWEGTPLAG